MGTDIHGVWQKKTGNRWEDIESTYDQDCHYLLFAFLAGVRNGVGFAGCPTHTPISPIVEPRGLPLDFLVSTSDSEFHPIKSLSVMNPSRQEYRIKYPEYHDEDKPLGIYMGDHSFSWVTVNEIINKKLPLITRFGVVSIEWFKTWDGKTPPKEYCGYISGRSIKVSSPGCIDGLTTHIQIEWEEDPNEQLKYFVDEAKRLKDLHGEVRFVFGFDS